MWPIGRESRVRALAVALMTAALSLGFPATALAHNVVEDRDPAAGSTVTESPLTVSVTTNDDFLDTGGATRGFALVARDSAGLYYGDGCVTITERTMSATMELGGAGIYTVLYQFVSADGHTLQESYDFVFEPSPDHVPAMGLSEAPVCGEPTEELPDQEMNPDVISPAPMDAPPVTADESVSLIPTVAGVIVLVVVLISLGISGLRKARERN